MQFNQKVINVLNVFMLCGVVLLSGCGVSNSNQDILPDTNSTEYKLVWSDEFNTGLSNWNIETGYGPNNDGWGNDESQLYTNSSDNVKVENGNLVITARCDSGVCGKRDGSITSARINTKGKFEFRYGKVEARIKVPSGRGTWPALWLLGSDFPTTPWPATGEIDMMEIHQQFSDINTTHSAMHWDEDGHKYSTNYKTLDVPLSDDFHVWSMEWDDSRIIFKIDGIKYFTKLIDPVTMREFLRSFYFILNLAVDGTLGGDPDAIKTTPQVMLVDWIRVYQKPAPSKLSLAESIPGSGTLNFTEILTSSNYGKNNTLVNLESNDTDAIEGDKVVKVDFSDDNSSADESYSKGFAFRFPSADLSCYKSLSLSVNSSEITDFDDMTVQLLDSRNSGASTDNTGRTAVQLNNYIYSTNANWTTYRIPLIDFTNVSLDDITRFGFWNPIDANHDLVNGTLFIDALSFVDANSSCYGGLGGSGAGQTETNSSQLVTNGSFDSDVSSWIGNAANWKDDNGNGVNYANVTTAGAAYNVNLSQVLTLENNTTYTLSFKAKGTANRTMVAGLGRYFGDYKNDSITVTLGANWQTYDRNITVTDFGSTNDRILFDMGADVGEVYIDDVSLVKNL